MRKRIFTTTFILFILAALNVKAQMYVNFGNDEPEIQNISKNPIHIVTSGNKQLDDALAASMQTYWKQSASIKIITKAEVTKLSKDPNNFFIAAVGYGVGVFYLNPATMEDDGNLALFRGKLGDHKPFMVIATVPFMLKDYKNAAVMTDYMVKAINDGVASVIKNDFKGRAGKKGVLTEASKNASVLKTKKLLIPEKMFDEKALKKYTLPYVVKPAAEIEKIIASGSKEYCLITYRIDIDNKNFFIYDLETKELVFAIFLLNGMYPGAGDLTKIMDAAEGKVEK
jgi:hypothetical protein